VVGGPVGEVVAQGGDRFQTEPLPGVAGAGEADPVSGGAMFGSTVVDAPDFFARFPPGKVIRWRDERRRQQADPGGIVDAAGRRGLPWSELGRGGRSGRGVAAADGRA
jgi:hypothetical protein